MRGRDRGKGRVMGWKGNTKDKERGKRKITKLRREKKRKKGVNCRAESGVGVGGNGKAKKFESSIMNFNASMTKNAFHQNPTVT